MNVDIVTSTRSQKRNLPAPSSRWRAIISSLPFPVRKGSASLFSPTLSLHTHFCFALLYTLA